MRSIIIFILVFLIQGCTGVALWSVNENDVKGQDLNEVIPKLKNRGLSCGEEYEIKDLGGKSFGLLICGAKSLSLICPTSYSARVIFDRSTRKVLSLSMDERDLCF
jgi:hypothetical protein